MGLESRNGMACRRLSCRLDSASAASEDTEERAFTATQLAAHTKNEDELGTGTKLAAVKATSNSDDIIRHSAADFLRSVNVDE